MKYKYGVLDTGHTVYKKIYKTKMFEIKIYDGVNAFDFHEVKLKNQIHIDWNYKKENKSNKKEFNAAKECVLTKINRMKTKFHDWEF